MYVCPHVYLSAGSTKDFLLWFWSRLCNKCASVYCVWYARCLFSSVPLGMYPVLRFLDQVVVLFWVLVVELCSFRVAVPFHTPIISVWKVFLFKKNCVCVRHVSENVCVSRYTCGGQKATPRGCPVGYCHVGLQSVFRGEVERHLPPQSHLSSPESFLSLQPSLHWLLIFL